MRRLLVLYGTALTSVVLLAFLVPLALFARSLAYDRAVEAARQEAQGLSVIVTNTGQRTLRQAVDAVNTGERQTTVYLPDGRLIGFTSPESDSVRLAETGRAFTAKTPGGIELLLPVGGADGVTVIRTFVPQSLLTEGVRRAWTSLAIVGLLMLVAAIVVGDRIASRLSRSVRDLADVADRVGHGDLAATVTPAGPPEVVSVGRVLNRLGARIAAMLAAERELSADLSHRLRTPVTALRLDAEALRDRDERERMTGHVDNLVEAVDHAVHAARHAGPGGVQPDCDAVAVVTDRASFWRVLAEETDRVLNLTVPAEAVIVPVAGDDLGAALDALVDNVFTHTPAGTEFGLVVARDTETVEIAVEDGGPGLRAEALAAGGVSGTGSTGIGLDVARRTAEQSGGVLLIERSALGGMRFAMSLPLQPLVES